MKEILEFIFSDAWHFLGIIVMLFIPATWRLINVDVTLLAVKPEDLEKVQKDED